MTDIQAFTTDIPASAEAVEISIPLGTQHISVEIADAARLPDLHDAWTDLLTRADAQNVLMDPVMVQASVDAYTSVQSWMLLAWKSQPDGKRKLSGIWALAAGHPHQSLVPMRVLNTPPGPHRYLSTPVIDRASMDETLHAMLDAIAAHPTLPKIIALDAMGTDGASIESLRRVLAARQSAPCILEEFRRPKLESELDGKAYLEKALSSSTRKKLRQHRRRLAEKGTLTSSVAAESGPVRQALEDFMRMEASGWKGREGTALLCDPNNAAFMRKAIVGMAELGRASIHGLYLNGSPVSMQIVVRAGGAAFTWKTAYDEKYQDFSPGMLLLEDYTAAFLADKTIAYVDSCAHDDSGYMSAWTGRQSIADMWIDARRGGSMSFVLLSWLQRSYRDLRALTKTAYLKMRR